MIIDQHMKSARALSLVRAIEGTFGVASIRHLNRTKGGLEFELRPFAPLERPAKKHKITNRAERKAKARLFTPENPVVKLGAVRLRAFRHASATV